MAYYIVKAGGSFFANAELMSDYTSVGVNNLIMNRKPHILLGQLLFKIADTEKQKILSMFDLVTVQSLDRFMECIECSDDPGCAKVISSSFLDTFEFGGVTFVPLKDLKLSGKYNFKRYMPQVKVCGSLFVALKSVFKDGRPSFYIVPKATE